MKLTRREFVKTTGVGTAGILLYKGGVLRNAYAYANSMPLKKFTQPMPMFGSDIPLAGVAPAQPYAGVDYYQITAGVFRQQLHPDLPNETRLYGYADHSLTYRHLGGAILATKDKPVRFTFNSALPPDHILPFDSSIPTLETTSTCRRDRAAVHLHGGLVPWPSDGGPFHWQCSDPTVVGASVDPWLWDGTVNTERSPAPANKVWDYFYPNNQSARMMWYHDHAIGQTRLNAYAGMATGYILQDSYDNIADGVLQNDYGIPFLGQPIVFQDKVFWDPNNDPAYADHVPGVQPGDLWYPWQYDPAIWPIAKGGFPPTPSAIPEFFGDTMLANGVVYPFHNVDQKTYRFRFLNACNARFLDLSFVQENASTGEPVLLKNGRPLAADVNVWQIGTEGGFLPTPVPLVLAGVPVQPFILAPAERADILVTFNAPGNVILYNVAGSPFPGGAPIFDWYLGNKRTFVATTPGNGPNTRTIMRFAVSTTKSAPITVPTSIPVTTVPTVPDPVNGGLMVDTTAIKVLFPEFAYDPVPVELTLNEVVEPVGFAQGVANSGRLLTLIGNRADPQPPFGAGGAYYFELPTESVQYNTIRIWKIYNFTADAHPMHFHLFNVQILGRQKVDRTFLPKSPAVMPMPNELGLKETVIVYPGESIIVAALVEDPMPPTLYPRDDNGRPQVAVTVRAHTVQCPVPPSKRLANAYNLTNHDEYVWHCHILEHEEHDMMRPLVAYDA